MSGGASAFLLFNRHNLRPNVQDGKKGDDLDKLLEGITAGSQVFPSFVQGQRVRKGAAVAGPTGGDDDVNARADAIATGGRQDIQNDLAESGSSELLDSGDGNSDGGVSDDDGGSASEDGEEADAREYSGSSSEGEDGMAGLMEGSSDDGAADGSEDVSLHTRGWHG